MNINDFFNKLKNATYINDPFPFLVIDDLFPENEYQYFLNNLPNDEEFKNNTTLKKKTRFYINDIKKLRKYKLLEKILDFFEDNKTFKFLCSVFKDDINKHMKSNIMFNEKPLIVASFQRMTQDYTINIHTDSGFAMFSMLYYPVVKNEKNWKFNMYKSKTQEYKVFPEKKDVILTKSISTCANRLFIYLDTPITYHCVTNEENANYNRKMLYIGYYFKCHQDGTIWKDYRKPGSHKKMIETFQNKHFI